jgi:hypothetical protein
VVPVVLLLALLSLLIPPLESNAGTDPSIAPHVFATQAARFRFISLVLRALIYSARGKKFAAKVLDHFLGLPK